MLQANKQKILFLIPTLMNGGAERVLVNLVNHLNREQFDISVKTLMNEGRYVNQLAEDIHYSYVFKKLYRGTRFLFNIFSPTYLYKKIIGDNYDIVVSYLEGPTARIISGGKNPNVKKVCWIHIELNDKKIFSLGFRSFSEAQTSYKSFDKIICVSETVRKIFMDVSKIDKDVMVLYNTNNTSDILQKSAEEVDDVYFDSEYINICSVAKVEFTKGYDRLLNIHKDLVNLGVKHRIYIIGEGSERINLEILAKKYSLQNSFIFLGYKENPYKYMKRCDIYVCSSRREGFSTAVTEALILGIPVVSTNCSGAYELLGYKNEYGIVTENNEKSLKEGLLSLLQNKDLIKKYTSSARERGSYFSLANTVKAVEQMLNNL